MKLNFPHNQELETDGIIGIRQEESGIVLVKYAGHETRLRSTTASEVIARVDEAKHSPDDHR